MDLHLVLIGVICLVSFANLFFTVLLSNSMFRIVASDSRRQRLKPKDPDTEGGLVDVQNSLTYDPRFRD